MQQREEVGGGGGTGEGDGVGVARGGGEEGADRVDRRCRDDGAVSGGDGDVCARRGQAFGEGFAGLLGAEEEEASGRDLPRSVGGLEGVGE